MKWIKKILRIIAIILPVICCALVSSGKTYAKTYSVDKIPFARPVELSYAPFRLEWSEAQATYADNLYYYDSNYNDTYCSYREYHNALSLATPTATSLMYSFPYSWSGLVPCKSLAPLENLVSASLPPYALGVPNFREWNNYYYQYDGLYTNDSNTDDGLDMKTKINFSQLMTPLPDSWSYWSLPLGVPDGIDETIVVNTPITINGEFWFDSNSGSYDDFSFVPGQFYARMYGYTSESDYLNSHMTTQDFQCLFSLNTGEGDASGIQYIDFTCSGNSNYSFINSLFAFNIFLYPSSLGYVINAPNTRDIVIDYISIILNNDNAVGGSWSGSVSGGETQNAPGSINNPKYHKVDTDSWNYKMAHLFNFSLFNPFNNIFSSFTDQSSCGSIPIISSMLHSNETTYCPWFNSTIRNVLTPVISMVSTMLLFGFFVSFLKSSTGNDVVDSGGHGSIYKGRLK